MEKLTNQEILIGRDPESSKLMISLFINGQHKTASIGDYVSNSISRCKPKEYLGHCKITINNVGDMTITNLNPNNVTFVNDRAVISKKITMDSIIKLGGEMFPLNLSNILDAAQIIIKKCSNATKKEYSIKHLEKVWEDFHKKDRELKVEQQKINLLKSLWLPSSIVSGAVGWISKNVLQIPEPFSSIISNSLYVISVAIMFYGLYKSITHKGLDIKEKLTDDFQDNYICPNPECRRYLGPSPYKIIKQYKNCPHCKCKFTEK